MNRYPGPNSVVDTLKYHRRPFDYNPREKTYISPYYCTTFHTPKYSFG